MEQPLQKHIHTHEYNSHKDMHVQITEQQRTLLLHLINVFSKQLLAHNHSPCAIPPILQMCPSIHWCTLPHVPHSLCILQPDKHHHGCIMLLYTTNNTWIEMHKTRSYSDTSKKSQGPKVWWTDINISWHTELHGTQQLFIGRLYSLDWNMKTME